MGWVVQSDNVVLSGGRVCFAMCQNGRVFRDGCVINRPIKCYPVPSLTHNSTVSGGCGSPNIFPHVSISDFNIRRGGGGGGGNHPTSPLHMPAEVVY